MRANATEYGLAAAVWTQSLDRMQAATRGIKAGTVWGEACTLPVALHFEEVGSAEPEVVLLLPRVPNASAQHALHSSGLPACLLLPTSCVCHH